MADSIKIDGRKYEVGGRLYYHNSHGQDMHGVIVGVHDDRPNGRALIQVKRDCWPTAEWICLDDYIRTRYWSPAWLKLEAERAARV